jgi:hypothetical protein
MGKHLGSLQGPVLRFRSRHYHHHHAPFEAVEVEHLNII